MEYSYGANRGYPSSHSSQGGIHGHAMQMQGSNVSRMAPNELENPNERMELRPRASTQLRGHDFANISSSGNYPPPPPFILAEYLDFNAIT
jgi:hypothetical protein